MADVSPLDLLRVPPSFVNLSAAYDFQRTEIGGVSLAVDSEARARIAAAADVARLGITEAIPCLISMLDQDRTSAVSADLVVAFSSGNATTADGLKAENMARLAEADLACHAAAEDALVLIGSSAVPALRDALIERSPYRRIGAARALGRIGAAAEAAVDLLNDLAKADPSETVRTAAAEAVKRIKPRRLFPF